MSKSRSKVEAVKEQSHALRGSIAEELRDGGASFTDDSKQLLKFHGLYQQDDRDLRVRREQTGKRYSIMVRSKIPGGRLTAEQYLVHDELASRFGNGTLRITTRGDFQLHGVLKGHVKDALVSINQSLITTFGACGDVVRNVMCCPLPVADSLRSAIHNHVKRLSDHLLPRTTAYHEIWLDGEKVPDARTAGAEEPIYGNAYLPRKFKIAVAHPGDNCVDVYTQDLGLVALAEKGELAGFNVLVGGGMGMTHNKPETFPRLGDPLAFVEPQQLLDVVEQIVRIQNEHGDRADRRHARLKYLVHDWGLDRFRGELERRLGRALVSPRPQPPFELKLHLGWRDQGDGRSCLGIFVENGRIADRGPRRLKTGLRRIVERFGPGVHLTPHQDLLLTGLEQDARSDVAALLREHGIRSEQKLSVVRRHALACPALPTCGLALAEAERLLPAVVQRLEVELRHLGLQDERLTVRMTGCPNGCVRPYVADVGLVGRSLDRYVIFLGGRRDGTRLNQIYRDLVPGGAIVETLRPLFVLFKQSREVGESFGDFCARAGIEALQAFAETHAKVALGG